MDVAEILSLALDDFGVYADLYGDTVLVLFDYPDDQSRPDTYLSDPQADDEYTAQMLRADLDELDLWPLPRDAELIYDDMRYRVLRSQSRGGAVTLYLREVGAL